MTRWPTRFHETCVNTLRPRQNYRYFTDTRFNSIFLNENPLILIRISLKFVHKGQIDNELAMVQLTHWGRVTHKCVSNLTIIVSDNGLSPGRRQAITWTNAGILLIGPLGTNFSEIVIGIQTFSFQKMHLKMSSANGRLFSLGLNELMACQRTADQPLSESMVA